MRIEDAERQTTQSLDSGVSPHKNYYLIEDFEFNDFKVKEILNKRTFSESIILFPLLPIHFLSGHPSILIYKALLPLKLFQGNMEVTFLKVKKYFQYHFRAALVLSKKT